MPKEYTFNQLPTAPLIIDAIYHGGNSKNVSTEPFHVLLPKIGNLGGIRKNLRTDKSGLPGYVVIYTSMAEIEWPDYLDHETGIFRYYGDNRTPGNDIHKTKQGGNALFRDIFQWLNEGGDKLENIPPILVFKKAGTGRDIQFLGLAAPGNINIPPDRDLISFWRTINGERFQNYEAYFTILDTRNEAISKDWLLELVNDHEHSLEHAPTAWQRFIKNGRKGIKPLLSPRILAIPSKQQQLPDDKESQEILKKIREYYQSFPQGFEKCATKLVQMMDHNFYQFDITRPWRDGGRDAIGKYHIGTPEHPLTIDCALEAKCYSEKNSVGVREMSRLISRIKYRQFGILVTTSFINKQAYSEILEDGHPILIVNARDIVNILRNSGIGIQDVDDWLSSCEY